MKRSIGFLLLTCMIGFWTPLVSALEYSFEFTQPTLLDSPRNLDGIAGDEPYVKLNMPGSPLAAHPGSPLIPHRPITLLIPQGETLDRISVTALDWVRIPGFHLLMPSQHELPLSLMENARPNAPDPVIYSSGSIYPDTLHSQPKIFWSKGYQLLTVNLFPVRYVPVRGEIDVASRMTVTIETRASDKPSDVVRVRDNEADRNWVLSRIDNPELLANYRTEASTRPSHLNSRDQFDYVIITTNTIMGIGGPNNFQDLLAFKASRGLSGTIKTVEQITAEYTGNDTAAKIRNFCADAYENWNTQWILLGADHPLVPTRGCYATGEGMEDDTIPTDMYFGCLDGTWDASGNGIYGEIHDGPSGGDPDVYAELYIGRASVENATQLHNFVSKTLLYETDNYSQEWADNVLLLGEYLWPATYGDYYMNELWHGSDECGYSTPGYPSTWDIDKLYASEASWGSSDLVPKLNSSNLFWVNHLGHANETTVMNLGISNVTGLTNARPFLVYSQGCYAGAFDTTDCIAENFSWSDHAAFSVIMNGRYGWGEIGNTDGSSQYFHRQFHDAYFTENIREIGKMNQDSKEDNVWCMDYKSNRWVCYELNLLGCPQTPINGIVTTRGQFAFDRTSYASGSTIFCDVHDVDLNTNPSAADSVDITISVDETSEIETVNLLETGPNTAIFQGSIVTTSGSASPENGFVDVIEGQTIRGEYIDASDGFGGTNVSMEDTATADFSSPSISNVFVSHLDDTSATIDWQTTELCTATIIYDTVTPPMAFSATVETFANTQSVTIPGLTPCLDYYFKVESSDAAGNIVTDDNAGAYYHFTTMIRVYALDETMNSNPGWTISGDWQFGDPTGQPSGPGSDPSSGFDGPNVYGTNINGTYQSAASPYYLTTPAIDCSACLGSELSFMRWLAIDGTDNDDNATIQISTNGSTWTTIYQNPPSNFYEYRWTLVTYDISAIADGQSTVYIRWGMGPGGTGSAGGWNIDNVQISYPAPCNVPILLHQTHQIDDSSGNNDGEINPLESIDMPVSLRNVGLDATGITANLISLNPSVVIDQSVSSYGNIAQGSSGSGSAPFTFHVTDSVSDGDAIQFVINWTSAETSGSASFMEDIVAAKFNFDSVYVIDPDRGDNDGILDPGETAQLSISIANDGRLDATQITGQLTVDHPEWVSISDAESDFPDIPAGGTGATLEPSFTVTAQADVPDHSLVRFTLHLDSYGHSRDVEFDLEITTSTFARRFAWPLDQDPEWTTEGQWAFGTPLGADGDPSSGFTGSNVYGYNLAGEYPDSMTLTSLVSEPINCANFTNVTVKFKRWLGIESSSYDHATFDVSTNGGTVWNTIWSHSGSTFTDPNWIDQSFDISSIADEEPVVHLRWTMGPTDSSITYCGWNIDDIEIWGEMNNPQPNLAYESHSIDDSSGNNDGMMNPGESALMDITAHNFGIGGSGFSAYLSTANPNVTVVQNASTFPAMSPGGSGSTDTPFEVSVSDSATDQEAILFSVTWTSSEGNGSFSFSETITAPDLAASGSVVVDPERGDADGILDPGETAQLMVTLLNSGHADATGISAALTSNHPEYIMIEDNSADFPDISMLTSATSLAPHFTVTANSFTPDHTMITFTLTISGEGISSITTCQQEVTSSTFARRHLWNLDSDPGWTADPNWAWGDPAGSGGDPQNGYTGSNVLGYNLNGTYENSMTEKHLVSMAIDCSQYQETEVRFMRWLGVESSTYDHATFAVSTNGTTWTAIWANAASTMTETSWSQQIYDVSAHADGHATVYLRWTMGTSDSSLVYSGWNLDDIEIWASSGTTPPTPTPANSATPTATRTASPTPTATRTPTMTPTFTPVPSATPSPPSPTPTTAITITPTPTVQVPTSTPVETATPAATATPMLPPGMTLTMPDLDLEAGETFMLEMDRCNPDTNVMSCDAYLLLDVYGVYWSWPSWQPLDNGLDSMHYDMNAASQDHETILNFEWPAGAGSASGLSFYGAMFHPGTWELIGDLQHISWSYH